MKWEKSIFNVVPNDFISILTIEMIFFIFESSEKIVPDPLYISEELFKINIKNL